MAARKKKEPETVVSQQEPVVVPAEMLAQLMAQIQTLAQEVGDLRAQAAKGSPANNPTDPPTHNAAPADLTPLGEVTQEEIDSAVASPEVMPEGFFAEEITEEPVDRETEVVDLEALEEQCPGLLEDIEAYNGSSASDDEEVSAEEAAALLQGFDAAMADDGLGSEPEVFALGEDSQAASDLSPNDIAALFAQAESSSQIPASAQPQTPEADEARADLSADDIAALFAQAESGQSAGSTEPDLTGQGMDGVDSPTHAPSGEVEEPVVASLTDEEIAMQVAQGAGADLAEEDDFDLDELGEEGLAALVRQSIEAQAEERALAEQSAPDVEEETGASEGDLMSAAEIAALLNTPDDDSDSIPASSTAMSDEELRALLAEATADSSEPIPEPDDLPDQEPDQAASSKPAANVKKPTGTPELGAVRAVPAHFAVRALALPIRFEDGKLVCQVAEPVDQAALDRLSQAAGFGLIIEKAPIDSVVQGIREAYAEIQDTHARFAVMASSQNRPGLMEKIAAMWKKSA
ncbi:MAG: hypothetical protein JSS71_10885 [Armatimonadetes bacterium]|nr:hypothetical protein [Armatimonadota bacterium]MBX3107925.1 hypothetical protein [Fimbriimonadaceae bacterium]